MERLKATEDQYIPALEEVNTANKEKIQSYLRDLKRYLISGKKTKESLSEEVYPLQLAWRQSDESANTDYPVFYDAVTNDLIPLYTTLENLVEEHFDQDEAAIISKELPQVFSTAKQKVKEEGNELTAQQWVVSILQHIQALDLPQKDTAAFAEKINSVQEELENQVNLLFDFNRITALQILNLQNKIRGDLKYEFLQNLKKVISGLNELLILHGEGSNLSGIQMDFAEDLIAFDKIKEVTTSKVSSQLPESRLQRLRSALQTLTAAQQYQAQSTTTIFATEAISKSFDLEQNFDNVTIKIVPENACRHANIQSQKNQDEFIQTIAALRIGQLMIDQQYEEALHDDYFDHFDLSHLTQTDLAYLPPTLVIENARKIARQSSDFLTSLSKNSFVKVLGLNTLDDLFEFQGQDKTDFLELASMAILRRNGYVVQGALDKPSALNNSFRSGLAFAGPVFWNILIPSGKMENEKVEKMALQAAIESRYFPYIEYVAKDNYFAGNQINLQHNPVADEHFVTCEQTINSPTGITSIETGVTVADFLAINPQLRETLEIVPPIYQSPQLISLHEYLAQSKDDLAGKMPFIWLVDQQEKLRQAVIPVYWIQQCRNRLEYWNFLQSISGINKVQLQNTLQTAKAEWEQAKNEELAALRSALQEQYEKEKSAELKKSVTNMLFGLLNQGNNVESVLSEISKQEVKPKVDVEQEAKAEPASPATEEAEEKKPAASAPVSEEAWVESEDCTSCNDCVDALPSVFKYNEDKQAYVHNPKGGTFAQIVKAAEKCPARCIHPGVPQNKKEAELDKWVKRAEKFN